MSGYYDPEADPKVRRAFMLSTSSLAKARAMAWGDGVPMDWITERAIVEFVAKRERQRGEPFPPAPEKMPTRRKGVTAPRAAPSGKAPKRKPPV